MKYVLTNECPKHCRCYVRQVRTHLSHALHLLSPLLISSHTQSMSEACCSNEEDAVSTGSSGGDTSDEFAIVKLLFARDNVSIRAAFVVISCMDTFSNFRHKYSMRRTHPEDVYN